MLNMPYGAILFVRSCINTCNNVLICTKERFICTLLNRKEAFLIDVVYLHYQYTIDSADLGRGSVFKYLEYIADSVVTNKYNESNSNPDIHFYFY